MDIAIWLVEGGLTSSTPDRFGRRNKRDHSMAYFSKSRASHSSQFVMFVLASALCASAGAQQPTDSSSTQVPSATRPSPPAQPLSATPKEGFWGKINPFASKKWAHRQTDPITGQVNELNEVNATNANDIQDVDSRSQAGIAKAQDSADVANKTATLAGQQAQQAGTIASQASLKVTQLDGTVSGLDQYTQTQTVSIEFRGAQPILSVSARKQLDELAATLTGRQGYLLELESYANHSGSYGIQSSEQLAEAVKRYLVTTHDIPVYRMHSVALGNVPAAGTGDTQPVRSSHVELRLMENSLAARDGSTPRFDPSRNGAERP